MLATTALRLSPTRRQVLELSCRVSSIVTSQRTYSSRKSGPFESITKKFTDSGKQNKGSRLKWLTTVISIGLGGLLGYKYWTRRLSNSVPSLAAAVPTGDYKMVQGHRAKNNFIADVVEVAAPALVYIEIKDSRRVDFFTGTPVTASNGSGFIIESNGLILTNAHVVINKPNTTVSVKLQDGRIFPGFIEDVDPTSDLATVRIQAANLPVLRLGNSASLRSGEWVIAMGSPLSLSNTITAGVVSSTQRPSQELGLRGRDINYIQTDAAITFGNSGGPLVNLDGEAIGINSMKVTPGISFAIPIDYAKEFLRKAAERRKGGYTLERPPVRRYMGITMLSLTPEILMELKQRSHDVPNHIRHGILVWKVIIGSPAHNGGLSPGDIINEINGKTMKTSQDVYEMLSGKESKLKMQVYRGTQKLTITVSPEDPEVAVE